MKLIVESETGQRQADLYTEEGLALVNELWTLAGFHHRIMYEPVWLGIPIIQYPGDIVMMQELIWKVRPELIIETGVAHGGSAVLFASLLELMGNGHVLAIDIEIRQHNRLAIESHPMAKRIELLQGSSLDKSVLGQAAEQAQGKTCLVVLDSNHSYDHVLEEMRQYSRFVSPDSYLVVMDGVQRMLAQAPTGKPEWNTDNPLNAIETFLAENAGKWEPDRRYERVGPTCSPMGFLRRVREKHEVPTV